MKSLFFSFLPSCNGMRSIIAWCVCILFGIVLLGCLKTGLAHNSVEKKEQQQGEESTIHVKYATGSIKVPVYSRRHKKKYGQIIRERYIYNALTALDLRRTPHGARHGDHARPEYINYGDEDFYYTDEERTALSEELERLLNAVADRMYYISFGGKDNEAQLEANDAKIWKAMKKAIKKQYNRNLIIVTYDEIDNDWVLCTVVKVKDMGKVDVPESKVLHFSAVQRVRVCCSYQLLYPTIERKALPFCDYIPHYKIVDITQTIYSTQGSHAASRSFSWEAARPITCVKPESVDDDTVIIDLFAVTEDSYQNNCKFLLSIPLCALHSPKLADATSLTDYAKRFEELARELALLRNMLFITIHRHSILPSSVKLPVKSV